MYQALQGVFARLSYQWQVLFVNDGSRDETGTRLYELASQYDNLYYINLSRNFGHQNALKAGLDHVQGDCVVMMDGDLQHPPALLPALLEKWEEGYDIVYTRRLATTGASLQKKTSSRWFYRVLNSLSDVEVEEGAADFRLVDQSVVRVLSNVHEYELFFRGMVKWIGFKQYAIDYTAAERHSGKSKYNFRKMFSFAVQGVTAFSVKPLHMATYLGIFFSALSLLYAPYILYSIIRGHTVSGWISLIITVVFFGGLQLMLIGVVGIYIGKIFMQSKGRPHYIIKDSNLHG